MRAVLSAGAHVAFAAILALTGTSPTRAAYHGPPDRYNGQPVATWINGHPINSGGYVEDGTPQRDDAHCVGSPYQIGACRAARRGYPGDMTPRNPTETCIVTRESGGDYEAWNPSGHYGRYQLSAELWGAYGGQSDYGAASPGEQDMVFVSVVVADSYTPWLPYDHC
jgi:hypothetical protein